jgi:hypothetical protein
MKSISKKDKINMKHYKKALTAHFKNFMKNTNIQRAALDIDINIAALKRYTGG